MANNITFKLPSEIKEKLEELEKLKDNAKSNLYFLEKKRNPNDLQHQVLFICLIRVVKYFESYLLLAKNGYGEPAVCILRSIFEALIWMRWSLLDYKNAEIYFNSSKAEAINMCEILISKNIAKIKNVPDPEKVKQILKSRVKQNKLPCWKYMADKSGLGDLYALIYPFLSAMSHGTMMFLGDRLKKHELSPEADSENISLFIPIAHNIFRDCDLVCKEWILNGQLRPVPDYRKLMTKD